MSKPTAEDAGIVRPVDDELFTTIETFVKAKTGGNPNFILLHPETVNGIDVTTILTNIGREDVITILLGMAERLARAPSVASN